MTASAGAIEALVVGPLGTNCYVLTRAGRAWVFDAGIWPEPLIEHVRKTGATLEGILLTHGHGDHIAGVGDLREAWPDTKLYCPVADAPMLADARLNMSALMGVEIVTDPADVLVSPGETLDLGDTQWRVLDTSGHTPGGVSYYCAELKVVITGDALFAQSIGRTDIPGANGPHLLDRIRTNLLPLPDDTAALPGHGPATTIGRERRENPFLIGR